LNYYIYKGKPVFSEMTLSDFEEISKKEFFAMESNTFYYIYSMGRRRSKNGFIVKNINDLYLLEETINDLFIAPSEVKNINDKEYLENLIEKSLVVAVNNEYENWISLIEDEKVSEKRVHLLGLGDVGSTLAIGLKLLGSDIISEIGIYDLGEERVGRWEMELNQISDPSGKRFPKVVKVKEENLFDCDMFIFCASKYVPAVGSDVKDVRMAQLSENLKIIKIYAKKARKAEFKGIFSVVSDPVDLLCAGLYHYSNIDDNGEMDCRGLSSHQIKGYGLGVMYGRARYYSEKKNIDFSLGRAYGPHGKDLIIANDIIDYDDDISIKLTDLTINANMDVRALGFKPYIAPAISSGAISIINTLKGEWNFSTIFLGGVYFGCRNRIIANVVDFERVNFNKELYKRIVSTYKELTDFGIENFEILR